MEQPDSNYVIGQLLFFALFLIPFAILIGVIARRKGKSGWLGLLGLAPALNFYVAIWIASLPDRDLILKIKELEKQTGDPR